METVSRANRLDPWFVTGVVEGEGSFTYSRRGEKLDLYFAVKMASRDRALLTDLMNYFGVGRIYAVKPSSGRAKRRASYYRVHRKLDHEAIVRHFDAYPLRGSKRNAFAVWREAWELMMRPAWEIDWSAISECADRLSLANRSG